MNVAKSIDHPVKLAGRRFSAVVRAKLKERDMPIAELARRVGLTRAAMSLIVNGECQPNVGIAAVIFAALNIRKHIADFV